MTLNELAQYVAERRKFVSPVSVEVEIHDEILDCTLIAPIAQYTFRVRSDFPKDQQEQSQIMDAMFDCIIQSIETFDFAEANRCHARFMQSESELIQ
jgi:hypothetical protein